MYIFQAFFTHNSIPHNAEDGEKRDTQSSSTSESSGTHL